MSQSAESDWLKAFLVHRVALLNSSDAWNHGIDRAANYEKIRQAGNFDFSAAIVTDAKANQLFPGGSYFDSGYPACVIAPDGTVSGPPDCTAQVSN